MKSDKVVPELNLQSYLLGHFQHKTYHMGKHIEDRIVANKEALRDMVILDQVKQELLNGAEACDDEKVRIQKRLPMPLNFDNVI